MSQRRRSGRGNKKEEEDGNAVSSALPATAATTSTSVVTSSPTSSSSSRSRRVTHTPSASPTQDEDDNAMLDIDTNIVSATDVSVVSASPTASPTALTLDDANDAQPSIAAAPAITDADDLVSSDGTNPSETKYQRLHHLLDQTSLFAQFLADKMPTKYAAVQAQQKGVAVGKAAAAAAATTASSASSSSDRSSSLHSLIPAQTPALTLKPFQVSGVDWLISLYENGLNGILADEMGLGKTIQVLLLLAHLHAHKVHGPYLIVAPLGTLPAWESECKRWTGMNSIVYHGDKSARAELRKKFLHVSSNDLDASYPIIITSYEISIHDAQYLKRVHWKMLIVDEGHRIKNRECLLLQKLKSLPSENRLLLTGTPLQNSLPELWSLLHFLLPDVFSSLSQFQSWFEFAESDLTDQAGQETLISAERDHLLVSKLHAILRPFVLRRVKSEVLKDVLQEKREFTIYTPMTLMQRMYYQSILDGSMKSLTNTKQLNERNVLMQLRKVCNHPYLAVDDKLEEERGIDMERKAEDPMANRSAVDAMNRNEEDDDNAILSSLLSGGKNFVANDDEEVEERKSGRQDIYEDGEESDDASSSEDEEDEESKEEYRAPSSSSRRKSRKGGVDDDNQQESFETITQRNKRRKISQASRARSASRTALIAAAPSSPSSFSSDPHRLIRVCGKLTFLSTLLPALRKRGSRVLIFSQMTRVLDILEDFLQLMIGQSKNKKDQFKYCRIDGTTTSAQRASQIKSFTEDPSYFVFLLSTRAGGLGLNLAASDTVILYDTDFNPTVDAQAMDRAHRLTQTRKVLVLRLVTPGSVEVGMLQRAGSKKRLEQVVLTKGRFDRGHQKGILQSTTNANNEESTHWRQQQGIVTELMELFSMTASTHAAIRTHLDQPMNSPTTSVSTVAAVSQSDDSSPPLTIDRRRSLKRKSTNPSPSHPPAAAAASSSSSAPPPPLKPFLFPSDWFDRLLDRDSAPPSNVIPQSSFECGYELVNQVSDKKGLLQMLTDHGGAECKDERKEG